LSNNLRDKVSSLNHQEKRCYCNRQNKKSAHKNIIPGNSKSLWNTVKTAKDLNMENSSKVTHLNGSKEKRVDMLDTIANYFDKKAKYIVNSVKYKEIAYNGKCSNIRK
jgi:hypothetical protein